MQRFLCLLRTFILKPLFLLVYLCVVEQKWISDVSLQYNYTFAVEEQAAKRIRPSVSWKLPFFRSLFVSSYQLWSMQSHREIMVLSGFMIMSFSHYWFWLFSFSVSCLGLLNMKDFLHANTLCRCVCVCDSFVCFCETLTSESKCISTEIGYIMRPKWCGTLSCSLVFKQCIYTSLFIS